MTTIIFILELAALAALTICGALLLLDVRDKKKRPEDEPDQTEEWLKPPEHINCRCTIYYPLDKKKKMQEATKRADWPETPKRKKGGLSYGVYKDSNGQKNVQRRILPRRI